MLSGRGLCDELITRPEESYRLCCVVVCDLEPSRMDAPYVYDISHLRVKVYRNWISCCPVAVSNCIETGSGSCLMAVLKCIERGSGSCPVAVLEVYRNRIRILLCGGVEASGGVS